MTACDVDRLSIGNNRFRIAVTPPRISIMDIFRTKSVDELREASYRESHFRRELHGWQLILLGIGCIIGTGIFVLTGTAAAQHAGPAIAISFVVSALGCLCSALCYAEFASMLPVTGSAYTYAYATMGEFIAWIIGWDLILEYLFGASTHRTFNRKIGPRSSPRTPVESGNLVGPESWPAPE